MKRPVDMSLTPPADMSQTKSPPCQYCQWPSLPVKVQPTTADTLLHRPLTTIIESLSNHVRIIVWWLSTSHHASCVIEMLSWPCATYRLTEDWTLFGGRWQMHRALALGLGGVVVLSNRRRPTYTKSIVVKICFILSIIWGCAHG